MAPLDSRCHAASAHSPSCSSPGAQAVALAASAVQGSTHHVYSSGAADTAADAITSSRIMRAFMPGIVLRRAYLIWICGVALAAAQLAATVKIPAGGGARLTSWTS